jgi:hypothetical protein
LSASQYVNTSSQLIESSVHLRATPIDLSIFYYARPWPDLVLAIAYYSQPRIFFVAYAYSNLFSTS